MWTNGPYTLSTDQNRLDLSTIHRHLTQVYWCEGIPYEVVEKAFRGSLAFGIYHGKQMGLHHDKQMGLHHGKQMGLHHGKQMGLHQGEQMVGWSRLITDRATFAYLADVFIVPEHRGKGLSKWMMEAIVAHPELQGLRRWMLATRDAHELYAQFGFVPMAAPERWMERHFPNVYRS